MKNKGLSLVELMVAMTIGLLVAAIVASLFVSIIRANSTTVQLSRLNQDLQTTMDLMARDMQRAGYYNDAIWNLARDTNGQPVNASGAITTINREAMFSAFEVTSAGVATTTLQDLQCLNDAGAQQAIANCPKVTIDSLTNLPRFNCILLRYDANDDGVVSGKDEIIGYRQAPTGLNKNSVETQSWDTIPAIDDEPCASADANWDDLAGNDSDLNISHLSFTLIPASGATSTNRQRSIVITITGQSVRKPELTVTLQREVRLRNDQF